MSIKRILILLINSVFLCVSLPAQTQKSEAELRAIFKRMDELRSQMSPAHKNILFEDFSGTGISYMSYSEYITKAYEKSINKKEAYEAELNHYLSQLGVDYISLPKAADYDSEEIELFGKLSFLVLSPEQEFHSYSNYLLTALSPFENIKKEDEKPNEFFSAINAVISMGNEDVYDMLNESTTNIMNNDGDYYRWILNRNNTQYTITLLETGEGFSFELSGISSLKEYDHSILVEEPEESSTKLQAAVDNGSSSLPEKYTIWVKTVTNWYIGVRDRNEAVYLKLALRSDGEMDYNIGSGVYYKAQGSKYSYTNGTWGKATSISTSGLQSEIEQAQKDYIIIPSNNMSKDKVQVNQSAAYFDDLEVYLP